VSELPAYVCSHVFKSERAVRLVSTQDGDWQFLCGDSHEVSETPHLVGLDHLLEGDPSLREVLDLQPDWEAEREGRGSPWIRRRVPDS
jgi:hypothetical protein